MDPRCAKSFYDFVTARGIDPPESMLFAEAFEYALEDTQRNTVPTPAATGSLVCANGGHAVCDGGSDYTYQAAAGEERPDDISVAFTFTSTG
jgi:hypothetical protein